MKSFWLVTALIVVLTCMTAWIFFSSKPEFFALKSDDGAFAISGTAYNAQSIYVTSHQINRDLIVYTILPESLAKQADMRVEYLGEEQLFVQDPVREAWRPIDSALMTRGHNVFAAGKKQEIELADYSAWLDEELATPPDHAVSYEQFFVYQVEESLPSYFKEDTVRRGKCSDVFFNARNKEEQKDMREVRIPVDGVMRLVRLTLVTHWFINRGEPTCTFVTQE